MPMLLECLSHTPLAGYYDPAPEVVAEVERLHAAARARVAEFDPELVVVFAPDHYNGFFYDVMPPFCIGASASAIGDFKSLAGPLDVPADTALALAEPCWRATSTWRCRTACRSITVARRRWSFSRAASTVIRSFPCSSTRSRRRWPRAAVRACSATRWAVRSRVWTNACW
jgi:hypothetical protein